MEKTEAIVIYSFPFKDKKYMVEMFTREHGRVSFVHRQRLQPLSIMSIVTGGTRPRLLSADIALAYKSLNYDPYKLSIGFFIADFLRYATRDEPRNTAFYDYVRQSLEWLDIVPQSYANFHLVLMMRTAQFLGFAPDTEGYRDGMLFDLREAQFVGAPPLTHGDFLRADDARHFVTLMRMSFATMHLFRLTKAQRNEIVDHIIRYYRLHIPSFPEMKSLDVLRELF